MLIPDNASVPAPFMVTPPEPEITPDSDPPLVGAKVKRPPAGAILPKPERLCPDTLIASAPPFELILLGSVTLPALAAMDSALAAALE